MQIFEHADLKDYLPPLDTPNFNLLRESIKEKGIQEPLVLWNDFDTKHHWLIDGYHRKRIADEVGIDYRTRLEYFDDLDSVKEWMIINQYARRSGGVPPFYISELVRIRTAREDAKTKTAVVEQVAEDLGIGRSTAFGALQKVKMGYENKQFSGDEFDQSAPEFDDEFNQALQVDYSQDGALDEFSQETPVFEQVKDGYVQDEYSQVQTRRAGGKKSNKPPSIKTLQKKSLTALKRALDVAQSAYFGAKTYNEGKLPPLVVKPLYEAIETIQLEMEKETNKRKFGGKRK